jgi:hypothetical protein
LLSTEITCDDFESLVLEALTTNDVVIQTNDFDGGVSTKSLALPSVFSFSFLVRTFDFLGETDKGKSIKMTK